MQKEDKKEENQCETPAAAAAWQSQPASTLPVVPAPELQRGIFSGIGSFSYYWVWLPVLSVITYLFTSSSPSAPPLASNSSPSAPPLSPSVPPWVLEWTPVVPADNELSRVLILEKSLAGYMEKMAQSNFFSENNVVDVVALMHQFDGWRGTLRRSFNERSLQEGIMNVLFFACQKAATDALAQMGAWQCLSDLRANSIMNDSNGLLDPNAHVCHSFASSIHGG